MRKQLHAIEGRWLRPRTQVRRKVLGQADSVEGATKLSCNLTVRRYAINHDCTALLDYRASKKEGACLT